MQARPTVCIALASRGFQVNPTLCPGLLLTTLLTTCLWLDPTYSLVMIVGRARTSLTRFCSQRSSMTKVIRRPRGPARLSIIYTETTEASAGLNHMMWGSPGAGSQSRHPRSRSRAPIAARHIARLRSSACSDSCSSKSRFILPSKLFCEEASKRVYPSTHLSRRPNATARCKNQGNPSTCPLVLRYKLSPMSNE